MGLLVWSMMGIAVWHFAVFVPDRFWGGIVGAFLAAIFGALASGLIAHGSAGRDIDTTDLGTALVAIPGAVVALAVVWVIGARAEADSDRT
jgi:hypothetical protein